MFFAIVSIEEIKNRDYDLTPKNPNKKEEIEYREPEEILKDIEEVDLEIEGIIRRLKTFYR